MLTLRERLRKARLEADKTQLEAATFIGKSRARYAQFEAGDGEPSLAELNALSVCFNVSAVWLTHEIESAPILPTKQRKPPSALLEPQPITPPPSQSLIASALREKRANQ